MTTTGLLGEVFYSGAVALSLTHPAGRESRRRSREVARRLNYGRLIVVDIVYVAIVIVGLLAVRRPRRPRLRLARPRRPGGRARGPHRARRLRRSFQLVRGNFWLVFLVLVPIELVGDAVAERSPSARPPPARPHLRRHLAGRVGLATSSSPPSSRSPRCC